MADSDEVTDDERLEVARRVSGLRDAEAYAFWHDPAMRPFFDALVLTEHELHAAHALIEAQRTAADLAEASLAEAQNTITALRGHLARSTLRAQEPESAQWNREALHILIDRLGHSLTKDQFVDEIERCLRASYASGKRDALVHH
jgi:hypothetical protein